MLLPVNCEAANVHGDNSAYRLAISLETGEGGPHSNLLLAARIGLGTGALVILPWQHLRGSSAEESLSLTKRRLLQGT
ncbi:hypothetical protein SAMN05444170_4399 [Bradyrhizobium erythrophlei]|jgi:hypothetical protein|uniref:Uncharacterized protein n=1 Tax=Bradyrhizobium erythrophlei TaxID=1437360 RepID=A0A1M7UBR7_9BRAD|nr:hypothetical protein SAMN05444170_4399 [Bradyrhizobium erythrophlei]